MKKVFLLVLFLTAQHSLLTLDIKFSNVTPEINDKISYEIEERNTIDGDLYLISYRFKDSTYKPKAESAIINLSNSFKIDKDDNFILFKLIDSKGKVYDNDGKYWQINVYDENITRENSKLNEALTYLGSGNSNYSRTPDFEIINNLLVDELNNYPNNVRANIAYETFKLDFKLIDYNEYKNNIEEILNTNINIKDELTVRSVITALNSINEANRAFDLEEKFIETVDNTELKREYTLDEISNIDDFDKFIEKSIEYLNEYNQLDKTEIVVRSFAYGHTQSKEFYSNLEKNLKKVNKKSAILYKYLALGFLESNSLKSELGNEEYLRIIELNLNNAFSLVDKLVNIKPYDISPIEFNTYKEKINSDLLLIGYRLDIIKNDSSSAFQKVYKAINKAPYQMNSRLYSEAVKLSSEYGSTENTKEIIRQAYLNNVVDSDLEEIILKIINDNTDLDIEFINQILEEKQNEFIKIINKNIVSESISGIVKSLYGKYRNLSDLDNRVHIISITSTWCDVCEETFPTLNRIENKYNDVDIIGISVWGDEDEENQLVKTINENNIEYKYYIDNTDVIPRKFNLFGFPTILIVDSNNKLRYTIRGYESEESLENTIDTVIELIE